MSKLSYALVDKCAHSGRKSPGVRIDYLYGHRLGFKLLQDVSDLVRLPVRRGLI